MVKSVLWKVVQRVMYSKGRLRDGGGEIIERGSMTVV